MAVGTGMHMGNVEEVEGGREQEKHEEDMQRHRKVHVMPYKE